ncbi:histidine phosphatase family protein [Streptomyces specialis]|uniref:histidine phosphatase family protein n=1 Tax=Streptomyces specialis TaxID=498367 RepID=UPI00073E69A2|nr:histidine phosphatase family protein [Streptomyces specialis]
MPVIHLLRHGQASFGGPAYDELSDLGRRQSVIAGRELARREPRHPLIVCGTLTRQLDTAGIVVGSGGFPMEPRIDARWDEYDFLAVLERYAVPEEPIGSAGVQDVLDLALLAWIEDPAQDGWPAFSGGAIAALEDLAATVTAERRDAVVVTSAGVVAALCGWLLGLPPGGVVALHRVAVNAAITTLVVGRSGTSLLAFNDHAHFAGQGRELLTYR